MILRKGCYAGFKFGLKKMNGLTSDDVRVGKVLRVK